MKSRRGRRPDPIARYLRGLRRWAPRHCREELVAEARRHLYDATAQARCTGASEETAKHLAIRAFGPAWRIGLAARGLARIELPHQQESAPSLLRRLQRSVRRLRPARSARWRVP